VLSTRVIKNVPTYCCKQPGALIYDIIDRRLMRLQQRQVPAWILTLSSSPFNTSSNSHPCDCLSYRWRFDCTGSCVQIPQIDDQKAHKTALASPRSAVKVHHKEQCFLCFFFSHILVLVCYCTVVRSFWPTTPPLDGGANKAFICVLP